jgi:hypothetical protein
MWTNASLQLSEQSCQHLCITHCKLLYTGEHIRSVLMLRRGTLVTLSSSGALLSSLNSGDCYGAECLTRGTTSSEPLVCTVHVRARTFCEALTLSAQAFAAVLSESGITVEDLIAASTDATITDDSNTGTTDGIVSSSGSSEEHRGYTHSSIDSSDMTTAVDSMFSSTASTTVAVVVVTDNTTAATAGGVMNSNNNKFGSTVVLNNTANDFKGLDDVAGASAATLDAIGHLTGFK